MRISTKPALQKLIALVASAERERIATILNHPEAAGRRALAEHLAFNTDTDVDNAVTLMGLAGKSQPPDLRSVAATAGDSLITKGNES
jgi:hypothetical protein